MSASAIPAWPIVCPVFSRPHRLPRRCPRRGRPARSRPRRAAPSARPGPSAARSAPRRRGRRGTDTTSVSDSRRLRSCVTPASARTSACSAVLSPWSRRTIRSTVSAACAAAGAAAITAASTHTTANRTVLETSISRLIGERRRGCTGLDRGTTAPGRLTRKPRRGGACTTCLLSGRPDSNWGPHRPERCALPGCATPRGGESSRVRRRDRRRARPVTPRTVSSTAVPDAATVSSTASVTPSTAPRDRAAAGDAADGVVDAARGALRPLIDRVGRLVDGARRRRRWSGRRSSLTGGRTATAVPSASASPARPLAGGFDARPLLLGRAAGSVGSNRSVGVRSGRRRPTWRGRRRPVRLTPHARIVALAAADALALVAARAVDDLDAPPAVAGVARGGRGPFVGAAVGDAAWPRRALAALGRAGPAARAATPSRRGARRRRAADAGDEHRGARGGLAPAAREVVGEHRQVRRSSGRGCGPRRGGVARRPPRRNFSERRERQERRRRCDATRSRTLGRVNRLAVQPGGQRLAAAATGSARGGGRAGACRACRAATATRGDDDPLDAQAAGAGDDVVVLLGQPAAGAEQRRLDGRAAHAHALADLLVGEALELAQDEDLVVGLD